MSDTPPRRSRRPPQKRGTPSLPFVPIFVAVIVLGFAIGAALSLVGRNQQRETASVATPSVAQTLEPVTPAPTEVPTPEPTTPPATPEPSESPEPSPSPVRTRAAATSAHRANSTPIAPSPAAAEAESPAAEATEAATSSPVTPSPAAASSRAPSVAAPVRAPGASPSAVVTGAPASTDQTDGDFGKEAASVVRGYIAAVAHGDIPSAYDALGQTMPANADLPEIGVIDGSTRIRHLETHGARDAVAVDVDLQTSAGFYLGQYTVHRSSSGGAVIVQHTIIKP